MLSVEVALKRSDWMSFCLKRKVEITLGCPKPTTCNAKSQHVVA
jgi:hypothetical protein